MFKVLCLKFKVDNYFQVQQQTLNFKLFQDKRMSETLLLESLGTLFSFLP
jgi:hypothetical protein